MTFDFDQLRFCRHERSVAPLIFNIKARGWAQCILWLKLSYKEVYEVCFLALPALSDKRACKKYCFPKFLNLLRCAIRAKRQRINKIQANSWYSSTPYAYGWYIARYTVHIYRLSGSNRAYHGVDVVKKLSFWFVDRAFRLEYCSTYRSTIIGELLFLSSCGKPRSG